MMPPHLNGLANKYINYFNYIEDKSKRPCRFYCYSGFLEKRGGRVERKRAERKREIWWVYGIVEERGFLLSSLPLSSSSPSIPVSSFRPFLFSSLLPLAPLSLSGAPGRALVLMGEMREREDREMFKGNSHTLQRLSTHYTDRGWHFYMLEYLDRSQGLILLEDWKSM